MRDEIAMWNISDEIDGYEIVQRAWKFITGQYDRIYYGIN